MKERNGKYKQGDFKKFLLPNSLSTFFSPFYLSCLCAQLAIAKNNIIKLQEENQQLRSENSLILLKAQQHLEVGAHSDLL